MQRALDLPMYGRLEYGPERDMAWQLFQTGLMARLRDISLSSTPSRFVPWGQAASRFAHSAAVGHLARVFCDAHPGLLSARDSRTLEAACLLHDVGSPPFSHVSEMFLWDALGVTHEQHTLALLSGDRDIRRILSRHDIDADEVAAAIRGEHPTLSVLVAGSLDLDNLDNSVHLLAALVGLDRLPYHPQRFVRDVFCVTDDGALGLRADQVGQVIAWRDVRRRLYSVLQGETQLASSSMLYRAIEAAYAADALPGDAHQWGEARALTWLSEQGPPVCRMLIEQLTTWHQYPCVLRISQTPDPRIVSLYGDWRARKKFADDLADQLSIPRAELCVYAGTDKAHKPVLLPWVGEDAESCAALFAGSAPTQTIAVFCHKRHHGRVGPVIEERVRELVAALDAPQSPMHVFF